MTSKSFRNVITVMALFFATFVGGVDRKLITILVQPMKQDLHLTDEAIGLLMGLGFSISYTLLAVPIGYLADRYGRRTILLYGATIWSMATACCTIAATFPSLLLARLGVGAGEATIQPTTFPIIAANFPPERRSLPMTIVMAGHPLGNLGALLLGGLFLQATAGSAPLTLPIIGTWFAWQGVYALAGLMGLIVVVGLRSVEESPAPKISTSPLKIKDAFSYFRRHSSIYVALFGTAAIFQIGHNAFVSWVAAYLSRTAHLPPAQVGLLLSSALLPTAFTGPILAGTLLHFTSLRPARAMVVLGIMLVAFIGAASLIFMLPWSTYSLAAISLTATLGTASTILPLMVVQAVTAAEFRSQATAIMAALTSIIGYSLGSALVGVLTTRVMGEGHLGQAIMVVIISTAPVAALLIFINIRGFAGLSTSR